MEDFKEQISSTTPTIDELRHGSEYGMGDTNKLFDDAASYLLDNKGPATRDPMVDEDDILDLAGGARDAIERHKATLPRFEDPPKYSYTDLATRDAEPTAPEPGPDRWVTGRFGDPTEEPKTKTMDAFADTETPKAEPRIPAKDSYSPGTESPYEPIFSSSAPSQPLMQSSAEGRIRPLGQESDSSRRGIVAPVSPLSPLHSPDSLEELSLSDSPNQAPFITVPFGSCPRPDTEAFSQKLVQDVPLGEEEKLFACKTWADNPNLQSGLDIDYRERSREPDKEGLRAAGYPHLESSLFSSSVITAEIDLGSKVDPARSLFGEDSGVASSPDEKLGSSVGSQEDGRTDSDKEGFDKDSGSGESAGSTPTRSPANPRLATEPYVACAPSNPTARSEAPYHLASRDNVKATDTASHGLFTSKTSWYETETLASKAKVDDDDDDSFLLEMKTAPAAKNPFHGFSPIVHSGFSQFGEMGSDSRVVRMSESPTPDLVQYAHDDVQDVPPTKHKEETHFDLVQTGSDSLKEPSVPSAPVSTSPKEAEDSPVQPSLPDILESSPLSPGKLDSDLSEGSPDSDQSPIQEIRMETRYVPVAHSATNPFAFDSDPKVSVLKDTPVATGARGAEMAGHAALPGLEKSFGGFDLVKEVDRYESVPYMNLPTCPASKAAPEDSDSDSPNTDSLSPVLEAMAKDPASFQVEVERNAKNFAAAPPPTKEAKDLPGSRMFSEDPEASEEEGFEQEVSSEEFEIIERPPKGAVDEFVEKLDRSKFAKASEMGAGDEDEEDDDDDDDDMLANFRPEKALPDAGSEFQRAGSRQSGSYTLLAQPASVPSPQMFGADLGNPFASTHQVKEAAPVPQAPLSHFAPEEAPKKPAPSQKTVENVGPCETAPPDAPKAAGSPPLSIEAVVELLYWRDLKKTGVVFGLSLFLLLSLTVCSIVSICSYAALALLSVTIVFRIYKGILQAVQKSEDGHPFKAQLEQDVALSQDTVHKYSDVALTRINCALRELRRLFLVEDLVDSLKFAVLMWILTYVGALFNGLTLLILGLISAFSMPVVYEKYQTQIDHYYGLLHSQVKDIVGKIQDKVPGLKRKAE